MKKNTLKLLITVLSVVALVLVLVLLFSFHSQKDAPETNTTTTTVIAPTEETSAAESITSAVSETATAGSTTATAVKSETKAGNTATATTKKASAAATTKKEDAIPITVNQALDALTAFYGTAYDVNATVTEDGYQYFSVTDKKGNKYSSVKVNLATSDAVETILDTGETNEFNLLG